MRINDQTAIALAYVIGFLATPVFFLIAGSIRIFATIIVLFMDSSMLITRLVESTKERRGIYS
jgi:hypothetical protein